MKNTTTKILALASFLSLAACAETPQNSSVGMLPPPGKSFDVFQQEQEYCRQAARQYVYGEAEHQNHRALFGGLGTTLLGAGIGAAAGGGEGAAIGAAAGALGGTLGGGFYSNGKEKPIQKEYDNQYSACMIARGNVPSGQAAPSIYANQPYQAYQQGYQNSQQASPQNYMQPSYGGYNNGYNGYPNPAGNANTAFPHY